MQTLRAEVAGRAAHAYRLPIWPNKPASADARAAEREAFGLSEMAIGAIAVKKLSAIIVELAETVLVRPGHAVCDEAAHAALLLAHVAWNREIREDGPPTRKQYETLLKRFAKANRAFVEDLRSAAFEALISDLRSYKRQRYPKDDRFITLCGTAPNGNVHVEWTE